MLVYGDPQFTCSTGEALALLRSTLATTNPDHLDSIRKLLIQLGQFEQAMADALEKASERTESLLLQIQETTNIAAELFRSVASGQTTNRSIQQIDETLFACRFPDVSLTIKTPEGFEFYSLFPEQFIAAALQWTQQNRASFPHTVLVLGIRSIGTTLSAVVTTTLRREGWKADRITVRPTGHPFHRILEQPIPFKADFAIIVDEGPGISGSSMVAVAEAVVRSGIPRKNISFLPGHNDEPGEAASATTADWWRTTPRIFFPLESLQWEQYDLQSTLLKKSADLRGKPFFKCEDASGGLWRQFAFPRQSDWPPAFAPFERAKYLCIADDGSVLLWKFTGLGSLSRSGDHRCKTLPGTVTKPLAHHLGFSAFAWIEGQRMNNQFVTEPILKRLADYLVAITGEPLLPLEHEMAIDRLEKMTFWNTRNVLGEAAGKTAISHARAARSCNRLPSYGDGKVAPWEWIHTTDGRIVKTDGSGHDADHTLIGNQNILWDIAGVIVEWDLADEFEETFLNRVRGNGVQFGSAPLAFFQTAYCAFQMGKSALCETMISDTAEKKRLEKAKQYYCRKLSKTCQTKSSQLYRSSRQKSTQLNPLFNTNFR